MRLVFTNFYFKMLYLIFFINKLLNDITVNIYFYTT